MFPVLRHALLLVVLLGSVIKADDGVTPATSYDESATTATQAATSTRASLNGSNTPAGNGTCVSRTANYITHTLPQQCLRTDWNIGNATYTNATESAVETQQTEVLQTTQLAEATSIANGNQFGVTGVHTVTPSHPNPETPNGTPTDNTGATTSSETANPDAVELESESPLDGANFMSFEEWRKKNHAKKGQENGGHGRGEPRQHPGINNALETIGEESEIDLDFSWFGSPAPNEANEPAQQPVSESSETEVISVGATNFRSKDAGKTCKERTNYASFDCAATVLKNNPECKSASSVLVEHKDSYMLNTCSADNKFLIVELCNDIQIDTIALANYEFFSSIFRHFRVSASETYPVKIDKWVELGTFEARNNRDIQSFLIENPVIWARYLRIEFLTHYGTEYYCPVSLLRVHGTTMMQDYRYQEALARGDIAEEENETEIEEVPLLELPQKPSNGRDGNATVPTTPDVNEPPKEAPSVVEDNPPPTPPTAPSKGLPPISTVDPFMIQGGNVFVTSGPPETTESTCASTLKPSETTNSPQQASETGQAPPETTTDDRVSDEMNVTSTITIRAPTTSTLTTTTTVTAIDSELITNSSMMVPQQTGMEAVANTTDVASQPRNTTTAPPVVSPSDVPQTSSSSISSSGKAPEVANSTVAASTNSTKGTASSGSAPAPQPSSQESFFKSIHKRLQQLESNSTLSLQYIEEQSRILRDAFNKVEKRQLSDTNTFLTHLNGTVMTELQIFRQQYDQLWQSTVIELENQRERYQDEMRALSGRLTLVAEELVWQKRMGIVQSTLLLLCLGLVLFAKQGNGYLEVPLMQQMMNKSQAALRAGLESPPNSPSPESRSPVSIFRRKIWRSSIGTVEHLTDDSRPETREGLEGLDLSVEPPTPVDQFFDDAREEIGQSLTQTHSSPATPSGTRERLKDPPGWPDVLDRTGSPLRSSH